jgi:hypothetical protein
MRNEWDAASGCLRSHAVFRFEAELWLWEGDAAWHFVTVPPEVSEEIKARTDGSVRVRATCGSSTWTTSVFPDAKRGGFVLPVKKEVRRAEGIAAGDVADFALELLDA